MLKVIRLLMVLCRRYSPQKRGGLLVLLGTQSSSAHTQLTCTVAAAGRGFGRVARDKQMVLETLASFVSVSVCECPCQEELYKFSENFGFLHFTFSFQVDHESQDVETETKRFLQRVSLVHSQVAIVFRVKTKELTQQKMFSFKSRSLMDYFIAKDCAAYEQCPFSVGHLHSCCQMHLVLGEKVHLLLPSKSVEDGLYGEIILTCLATLGPCMTCYPNWPARLAHIHVIAYGPSGLPIMRGEEPTQLSFLQSLADLPFWRKLGLTGVHCADSHTAQGSKFYEIQFSTEDEHQPETEPAQTKAVREDLNSEVRTVEQTITVLLLIQHTDPFNSQLSDIITSEEILERQVDRVLRCNAEKVRLALQSLLENTLKEYIKRKKFREKLQSVMSVIVGSVSSIVSSSSSAEFRSACFSSMKVQNTTDLSVALHQNLQRVISGRLVSKCAPGKAVETTVSEQDDRETAEEDLSGKRTEREVEESPVISKRWCSRIMEEDLESFESDWEAMDSQMNPLSSSQQSLTHVIDELRSSPSSQSTTYQKNQQVEREWLLELDNLSDWD